MKPAPFELEGATKSNQPTIEQGSVFDLPQRKSDDAISTVSFNTQKTASSTDGIDVLGSMAKPDTFLDWNTSWIGHFVSNIFFKRTVIALILLDSALMGIATFDFVTENEQVRALFFNVNMAFLSLFTVELILRMIHHRTDIFSNGWLIFDFVVISCSWILSLLVVVRAFRVIRALRLATRLKDLRTLALAFQEVMPKVTATAFIVALSFYIFSIMFTDLYKDLHREGYTDQDYFSSIDITAFTLFQIMTLDQWSTITKEVQQAHPFAWLLFVAFVVSSSFFILNLTIAVIYEAIVRVQNREIEDPIMRSQDLVEPFDGKTSDSLSRLEHKVDSLTTCVELLLRKQTQLQASVSDMTQSTLWDMQ
jgi:voltage-gated sodium channel